MLAWLNAVPDAGTEQRSLAKASEPEEKRKSRFQALKDEGKEPRLPWIDGGEHLVLWLMEVGPAASSGMGMERISYREIGEWQRLCGIPVQPWEVRALRRLSGEYIQQSEISRDPLCPQPWLEELPDDDRAQVSDKISQMFRSMIAAQKHQQQ